MDMHLTPTADRLNNAVAEFSRLKFLDLSKLRQLMADRVTLDQRLRENRAALLATRPSTKGYDQETERLTALTGSLQAQIDATAEDIGKEVLELRYKAATQFDFSDRENRIKALDAEAVTLFMRLRDALIERHELTEEVNELRAIVGQYALDLRLDSPRPIGLPWLGAWPGWPGCVDAYFRRLYLLSSAGRPEPGKELDWISRRVV